MSNTAKHNLNMAKAAPLGPIIIRASTDDDGPSILGRRGTAKKTNNGCFARDEAPSSSWELWDDFIDPTDRTLTCRPIRRRHWFSLS
ncbi:hypothetical protein CEP53_009185 [Fusarium sp. AF-6]|nr:hypothetical protein CEP53_009185 [Fusarium sp. AF-6]